VKSAADKLASSLALVDQSLTEIIADCDPLVANYVAEAASARGG
jgi:hypothetical protein